LSIDLKIFGKIYSSKKSHGTFFEKKLGGTPSLGVPSKCENLGGIDSRGRVLSNGEKIFRLHCT